MPLAIELAAARAEALGVTELASRFGEWLRLLTARGRQAATRHRSLAAVADWSYRLLGQPGQRVFRQLAVFPGPFTLAAVEALAGQDAGAAVVHLVDCSLLVPPGMGADGRSRYRMLDTLRSYAAERLAEAGEQPEAAARLARYAVEVAEEAAAGLETSTGELAAARWLDAEDATVHQALDWALEHDRACALRLALALAPWWALRSRLAAGYRLLSAAAADAAVGGEAWGAAQYWLGDLVADSDAVALAHFTAARDALAAHNPGPLLVRALNGRAFLLIHGGHIPEGAGEARRALAMARELGYPTGEAIALRCHALAAYFSGEHEESLAWARQALRIDPATIPGPIVRLISEDLAEMLMATGHHHDALRYLADALALAREAGDLTSHAGCLQLMTELDLLAGRVPEARAQLREAIELSVRSADHFRLLNCLETCGHLCAQTHRYVDALTVWAAVGAVLDSLGMSNIQPDVNGASSRCGRPGKRSGPPEPRQRRTAALR